MSSNFQQIIDDGCTDIDQHTYHGFVTQGSCANNDNTCLLNKCNTSNVTNYKGINLGKPTCVSAGGIVSGTWKIRDTACKIPSHPIYYLLIFGGIFIFIIVLIFIFYMIFKK